MALPAIVGAAISRARSVGAIAPVLGGRASQRGGRRARSCCLTSSVGCGACSVVAGIVALSIGSLLVLAMASVVGLGGQRACGAHSPTVCAPLTGGLAGAPMNCPGLYVSQGFGDTPWEHPHTGIDIVCPPETMVVAAAAGVFHRETGHPIRCSYPAGRTGGLGTYGLLGAGNVTYLYGHLDGFVAGDGARVVIGQPLGFEGATGCATGDHLHFEVLEQGTPVDPCLVLPAGYPDQHDRTGLRCWGAAPP